MIGGALRFLEFLQDRFSFSLASDYRDHSGRAVRSDVVQDDRKGMIRVVECQKESIAELGKVDCTASLRILDFDIPRRRILRAGMCALIRAHKEVVRLVLAGWDYGEAKTPAIFFQQCSRVNGRFSRHEVLCKKIKRRSVQIASSMIRRL